MWTLWGFKLDRKQKMLLTIKPTSRLPNKHVQKPTGAVTVTPSIITCSRCFSLRFQLPPQTASRDVTLSIKLDQNCLVSCGFLCRLDCLIMWRWRRFSAKPAVTSLKGDMLTRACFFAFVVFFFFCLGGHDTGAANGFFGRTRDNFADWSLQTVSARRSIWQTTGGATCNLVDYVHIHIDYHVVTSLLTLTSQPVLCGRGCALLIGVHEEGFNCTVTNSLTHRQWSLAVSFALDGNHCR